MKNDEFDKLLDEIGGKSSKEDNELYDKVNEIGNFLYEYDKPKKDRNGEKK